MKAITPKPLGESATHGHLLFDCWLCCILCERFFLLSSARDAGEGELHRCPFSDCTGHGLGFELHPWDTHRVPEDPRWPASDAALYHGMRAPDYATFAEAQFKKRVAPVLDAFAVSPEYRAEFERPPRYTETFLSMMAGVYHSDLTDLEDDEWFDAEVAGELLCDLPVYAHTADLAEAPRMLAELRALFAFAARTGCLASARDYATLLADDAFADHFRHVMRTDRRLEDQRSSGKRATERTQRRRRRKKRR